MLLPLVLLGVVIALARNGPRDGARAGSGAADAGATVTCSFSNPGYSGFCRQAQVLARGASAAKACTGMLRCLNDVRCVKTYCEATTIRTGWKLERVETSTRP
ncbi:MAG: hypothetical protein ABI592_13915 [Acidobacteriota bacterium]